MSGTPAAFDLSRFSGSIVACEPAAWRGYRSTLDVLASGRVQIAATEAARRRPTTATQGKVAVISVTGYLSDHRSWISDCLGWSTYDEIGMAADACAADAGVSAVVLDVDSGGGDVMGCQECADRIAACAQVRPVIGFVNAYAASAAYWLASQSNLLLMMPSGQVGSVGVLAVHTSFAGANAQAGIETTYITSSGAPFKAEMNSDTALGDAARAYQLKQCNDYHASFVGAVARGRLTSVGKVERDFGGGRVKGSADALASNMVCGLESTLLRVIARAAAGEGKPKSRSATAEGRRAILAQLAAEGAALEAKIAAYDAQHGGHAAGRARPGIQALK